MIRMLFRKLKMLPVVTYNATRWKGSSFIINRVKVLCVLLPMVVTTLTDTECEDTFYMCQDLRGVIKIPTRLNYA